MSDGAAPLLCPGLDGWSEASVPASRCTPGVRHHKEMGSRPSGDGPGGVPRVPHLRFDVSSERRVAPSATTGRKSIVDVTLRPRAAMPTRPALGPLPKNVTSSNITRWRCGHPFVHRLATTSHECGKCRPTTRTRARPCGEIDVDDIVEGALQLVEMWLGARCASLPTNSASPRPSPTTTFTTRTHRSTLSRMPLAANDRHPILRSPGTSRCGRYSRDRRLPSRSARNSAPFPPGMDGFENRSTTWSTMIEARESSIARSVSRRSDQ
jgi:hypothetical protein